MYYLSLLFFVKLNTMFSHVLINQGWLEFLLQNRNIPLAALEAK